MIALGCPSLVFISLYRCNITDAGLETLVTCRALQDVNLSYCSFVTDQGIKILVQNCSHLNAIRICNCDLISGVGFTGCSENLAYLDAESCKLTPEGIASMVSGGGMEYLNVSGLSWAPGNGFVSIGAGLATRLRVLNMRLCRTMRSESVAAIAVGCPLLQEWNLALCHEVRLLGWESIALHCQSLRKLHVNRCRNLCSLGLVTLARCNRLSVLYIHGCPRVCPYAMEVLRLQRHDIVIREEEKLVIGPPWAFGDYCITDRHRNN